VYIVAFREVRAVMAAAAFLAPQRRARDEHGHGENARSPPSFRVLRLAVAPARIEQPPRVLE
jgi:hypothetical protein